MQLARRGCNGQNGCKRIVGGVSLDCNLGVWDPMSQDRSGSESLLKCIEGDIKPWVFNIVVQFVPFMFRPEKDADLRELEQVNGLDDRAMMKARWIKPAARRSPSQTCSHMILSFSSPVPANDTLAYGLFICQKKVYAEKCKKEPLRCLMSQMPPLGACGRRLPGSA